MEDKPIKRYIIKDAMVYDRVKRKYLSTKEVTARLNSYEIDKYINSCIDKKYFDDDWEPY